MTSSAVFNHKCLHGMSSFDVRVTSTSDNLDVSQNTGVFKDIFNGKFHADNKHPTRTEIGNPRKVSYQLGPPSYTRAKPGTLLINGFARERKFTPDSLVFEVVDEAKISAFEKHCDKYFPQMRT